ncbi:ankyrin repeat domain-containing protein [Thiotrichales bacterium 19X7-9]|nr:ankyrin repeat domain-containing protein [Thiotrichales bacterium 19X7-9]
MPQLTASFFEIAEIKKEIDPVILNQLYSDEPYYYHNEQDSDFNFAKAQLITLMNHIISLNPDGMDKLNELKVKIASDFTEAKINSHPDRVAILHSMKKELELLYCNYQEEIKNADKANFNDLIVNQCYQGAYSNILMLSNRLTCTDFSSTIVQAKKEALIQLAAQFTKNNNLCDIPGNEIHFTNTLYNHIANDYNLLTIEDAFIPNIDGNTLEAFKAYVQANLNYNLLIKQLDQRSWILPDYTTENTGLIHKLLPDNINKEKFTDELFDTEFQINDPQRIKALLLDFALHASAFVENNYIVLQSNGQNSDIKPIIYTPNDLFVIDNDTKREELSRTSNNYFKPVSDQDIDLLKHYLKDLDQLEVSPCFRYLSQETIGKLANEAIQNGYKNVIQSLALSLWAKNEHLNDESEDFICLQIKENHQAFLNNIASINGQHPYDFGAKYNNIKIISEMLAQGVPCNLSSVAAIAAENGQSDVIDYLFHNYGTSNNLFEAVDGLNRTFVHYAAINGHVNIFDKLQELQQAQDQSDIKFLGLNFIQNLAQADASSTTAAHYAAINGHPDILEKLHSLNIINLNYDILNGLAILASENKKVNVLKLLQEHGVDISFSVSQLIEDASKTGNVSLLRDIAKLDNIDFKQKVGTSMEAPAHLAATYGHVNVLKFLNDFTEFDEIDFNGNTPAHRAAQYGQLKVIQFFKEHKIELLEQPNNSNEAPLDLAIMHGHLNLLADTFNDASTLDAEDFKSFCLYVATTAAKHGKEDVLNFLKERLPTQDFIDALQTADDTEKTAAQYTIENGHTNLFSSLIKELNVSSDLMISYAKLATELGESDILELALNQLKLDASLSFGIFVNDLAMIAASNNKNNIIELLSNNYLLDLQSQAMTLAETATKNDHYDTVEFLLSYIKEHDAEKLNDTLEHLAIIATEYGATNIYSSLVEYGYNYQSQIHRLAQIAASHNHHQLFCMFANEIDIHQQPGLYQSALAMLDCATKKSDAESLNFLIEKLQPSDTFNLNETTYHLAEIAAKNGSDQIIELLNERYALDLHKHGKALSEIALANDHEELAEELSECANTQPEGPPQLFDAIPNQDLLQRMGYGYD